MICKQCERIIDHPKEGDNIFKLNSQFVCANCARKLKRTNAIRTEELDQIITLEPSVVPLMRILMKLYFILGLIDVCFMLVESITLSILSFSFLIFSSALLFGCCELVKLLNELNNQKKFN